MKRVRVLNQGKWNPSSIRPIRKQPWYASYRGSKTRCINPNCLQYKYYGGKGIKFLLTPYEISTMWIRDGASNMKRASIDRIDPKGNYEYFNCRFMELSENTSRARKNVPWSQERRDAHPKTISEEHRLKIQTTMRRIYA